MAKAADKTITLREAKALVVKAYGSPRLAEKLLVEWLREGRVRWSCKRFEGLDEAGLAKLRRDYAFVFPGPPERSHSIGEPQFWRSRLEINWEESWAREKGMSGACAHMITVPLADVQAQLGEPSEHVEEDGSGATKTWIVAEVKRMNAAHEIPQNIKITGLAKELAKRMRKAAETTDSTRAVTWRYIQNQLPKWGLWPNPHQIV